MQLNTDLNDPFGCPFSLDKVYVDPIGTAAAAVDFGHRHSEIHRLTLNLTARRRLTHTLFTAINSDRFSQSSS